MKVSKIMSTLSGRALSSGAHKPSRDPLKNTKKIATEGHSSLYENGALEIPSTTIHIIPPGPGTFNLASQMAGMHARNSFEESIKHLHKSIDLTRSGVNKSSNIAFVTQQGAAYIIKGARTATRFGARMAGASLRKIRNTVNASFTYSVEVFHSIKKLGDELAHGSLKTGGKFYKGVKCTSARMFSNTIELASRISSTSRRASRRHASYTIKRFVKDYTALPAKIRARIKNIANCFSYGKFARAYHNANYWRAKQSKSLFQQLIDSTRRKDYVNDIKASFHTARRELSETHDSGYTFALLKSLRWVMQGILWNATIKPALKIAAASFGYVIVNTVVFPVLLTFNEAVVVLITAAQTLWNSAVLVYEIIEPIVIAVAVGLFSAVELVGGLVLVGAELFVGLLGTAVTYGLGKMCAAVITGSGYIAGKTMQYVGAPLACIGFAIGGSTIGVVGGATNAFAGSVIVIAGVTGEAATQIISNVAAGGILVGGFSASVVAGAALGAYLLAKAVVFPVGYELVSGLIIVYCSLMQLIAHVVLAIADALYMVLSLEGAKWALSTVRGTSGK